MHLLLPTASRLGCRAMILAVLVSVTGALLPTSRGQAPAFGDPVVKVRVIEPESGVWRLPGLLAVEVELEHPASRRLEPAPDWRLAPTNGWLSAVTLQVTDPSGKQVSWPFQRSGGRPDDPLQVGAVFSAIAGFSLSPRATNLAVAEGEHRLQAVVECTSGDGWRGRVISRPVSLNVRPLPPHRLLLEVEPVVEGLLVQGWPWGVRAELVNPLQESSRSPRIEGGGQRWPAQLTWIVRGADGREVNWPWIAPVLATSDESWIESGKRFPAAQYRLSATNTASIPPGEYTVVARYSRASQGAGDLFWSGTLDSRPLTVRVIAASQMPAASQAHRYRSSGGDS